MASAGLSERLGQRGRRSGSPVEQTGWQGEEGGEEGSGEEEDTMEDNEVGRMLSQLSARQGTLYCNAGDVSTALVSALIPASNRTRCIGQGYNGERAEKSPSCQLLLV